MGKKILDRSPLVRSVRQQYEQRRSATQPAPASDAAAAPRSMQEKTKRRRDTGRSSTIFGPSNTLGG